MPPPPVVYKLDPATEADERVPKDSIHVPTGPYADGLIHKAHDPRGKIDPVNAAAARHERMAFHQALNQIEPGRNFNDHDVTKHIQALRDLSGTSEGAAKLRDAGVAGYLPLAMELPRVVTPDHTIRSADSAPTAEKNSQLVRLLTMKARGLAALAREHVKAADVAASPPIGEPVKLPEPKVLPSGFVELGPGEYSENAYTARIKGALGQPTLPIDLDIPFQKGKPGRLVGGKARMAFVAKLVERKEDPATVLHTLTRFGMGPRAAKNLYNRMLALAQPAATDEPPIPGPAKPEKLSRRFHPTAAQDLTNTIAGNYLDAWRENVPFGSHTVHDILADRLGDHDDPREDIVRRRMGVGARQGSYAGPQHLVPTIAEKGGVSHPAVLAASYDAPMRHVQHGDGGVTTVHQYAQKPEGGAYTGGSVYHIRTRLPHPTTDAPTGHTQEYHAVMDHGEYNNWLHSMHPDEAAKFRFPGHQDVAAHTQRPAQLARNPGTGLAVHPDLDRAVHRTLWHVRNRYKTSHPATAALADRVIAGIPGNAASLGANLRKLNDPAADLHEWATHDRDTNVDKFIENKIAQSVRKQPLESPASFYDKVREHYNSGHERLVQHLTEALGNSEYAKLGQTKNLSEAVTDSVNRIADKHITREHLSRIVNKTRPEPRKLPEPSEAVGEAAKLVDRLYQGATTDKNALQKHYAVKRFLTMRSPGGEAGGKLNRMRQYATRVFGSTDKAVAAIDEAIKHLENRAGETQGH
jgi:hypothetical protein